MTTSPDDLIEHWARVQCTIQDVETASVYNLTKRVDTMFKERLTFNQVFMDYMREQIKCP